MLKSNFEKSVALGGAVTTVFGILSSFNPYLAYALVDYFSNRLRPFPVSEFQPLPLTIGLLLSSFGGILGLVVAVKWRRAPRSILRWGSLLGCAGLLVFLLEFGSVVWWIMWKYRIGLWPGIIVVPGVGFYFVLFGSLLMLERVTMGRILRRIAFGTSATSLALLVLVLCMFFSPVLDLAFPLFLTILRLPSFLGGLSAVIGTVLSLALIYRSKKGVKVLVLGMKRLAGGLCAFLGVSLLIGGLNKWYESTLPWIIHPYRDLAIPIIILGVILIIAGGFLYFYTPKETQGLESMNSSSH